MNSGAGGVGMLLSPSADNSLVGNIVVVNSRIMVANFSGNPATTIICCYNPTNFSDDSDAPEFYNTVSEVIKKLPGNNLNVICGNMNAQISPLYCYGFSFTKKTNRNGQFMLDMFLTCALIICHTRLQKSNEK